MKQTNLKLLFVVSLFLSCFAANSQTFGVKAGLNTARVDVNDRISGQTIPFDNITAFHVGCGVDFELNKFFSIEPDLLISIKGFESRAPFLSLDSEIRIRYRLAYIDLPLYLKFRKQIEGVDLFAGVGPYVSFAAVGESLSEIITPDESQSTTETFKIGKESPEDFQQLDYGLSIITGARFKAFSLSFSYGHGMYNIHESTDNEWLNRVASFSLAYWFLRD